jgi:hypothetical protein
MGFNEKETASIPTCFKKVISSAALSEKLSNLVDIFMIDSEPPGAKIKDPSRAN